MKFARPSFSLEAKPTWAIILRGAAIPGIMVGVCIIIAVISALFDGGSLRSRANLGAIVGMFFSLWGGIEMMVGIVISSNEFRTNALMAVGYFIVWASCLTLIFS